MRSQLPSRKCSTVSAAPNGVERSWVTAPDEALSSLASQGNPFTWLALVFVLSAPMRSSVKLQDGQKGLLRDVDLAHLLHPFFPLFLLFEELPLSGDVATVAFRRHVLAHRAHGLATDDPRPDRRLDRDLVLLA